jgi:hypothetical protein
MRRLRWAAAAATALGVATSIAPAVHADTLCVKRSGQVVARATCKRKERPFDPAALGLVGVPGPAGAPGEPGAPGAPGGHPYRVVDATGKQFGTTMHFDAARAQVIVTVPGDELPVQFVVQYGAFEDDLNPFVHYDQPGCTGTPLIFGSTGLVPGVHVVGDVGYYTREGATIVDTASREYVDDACSSGDTATDRGTCCSNATGQRYAAPARTVPMASLDVTLPLTIRP